MDTDFNNWLEVQHLRMMRWFVSIMCVGYAVAMIDSFDEFDAWLLAAAAIAALTCAALWLRVLPAWGVWLAFAAVNLTSTVRSVQADHYANGSVCAMIVVGMTVLAWRARGAQSQRALERATAEAGERSP